MSESIGILVVDDDKEIADLVGDLFVQRTISLQSIQCYRRVKAFGCQ